MPKHISTTLDTIRVQQSLVNGDIAEIEADLADEVNGVLPIDNSKLRDLTVQRRNLESVQIGLSVMDKIPPLPR